MVALPAMGSVRFEMSPNAKDRVVSFRCKPTVFAQQVGDFIVSSFDRMIERCAPVVVFGVDVRAVVKQQLYNICFVRIVDGCLPVGVSYFHIRAIIYKYFNNIFLAFRYCIMERGISVNTTIHIQICPVS